MLTPVNNMPAVLQYLSLLNPARYFVTITIGVFMKEVGLETLWPQVASLAVLDAAIFSLSLLRWRGDSRSTTGEWDAPGALASPSTEQPAAAPRRRLRSRGLIRLS